MNFTGLCSISENDMIEFTPIEKHIRIQFEDCRLYVPFFEHDSKRDWRLPTANELFKIREQQWLTGPASGVNIMRDEMYLCDDGGMIGLWDDLPRTCATSSGSLAWLMLVRDLEQ